MLRIKTPIFFFGLFIGIASLFILFLTFNELEENTSYHLDATKGELNLTSIDFNKTKICGLVGEFEFYWMQLLTPSNINESANRLTGYITLPGLWNDYIVDGKKLKGDGYATFRLRVKVTDEDFYALKIKEFDCAYQIWVNGVYEQCGKVGTNKNEEVPSWKRNEVIFFSKDKQVDIILQISNFNHRKGGPEDLMLLGKSSSILSYKSKQSAITYFMLGLFFIMLIYNYGLYNYRRKEKSYLYFSIICLLIVLRLSTTSEKNIYDILPTINWWVMIRIEYLSYTIVIPIIYMFMRGLYPDNFPRLYGKILNIACAIVVVIILFTPVKIFSYTPIFYQIFVALTAILILAGLIRAVIQKKDDSVFMLFGYIMLFAICINDILYYNKILNTTFLMPFGLFVIVFVNAFTLSKRFSNSFTTIEALTQELSQSNIELEKKVEERTKLVVAQKQEIENQTLALQETNKKIVDLGKFKDSMTNMIVHDLKNPLNTILNLSMLEDIPQKDFLIHEAGRTMNDLVMNILDVYKYENTTMVLRKESVSITELIDDSLEDVAFLAKVREVEFITNIDKNIAIEIDRSVLQRVLVNLLTNAIKFSPLKGKIEVNTTISESNSITISVKDSGYGIRSERLKNIFEHYQSEAPPDSMIRSTGLGLSFCKLAVESHGGIITVDSVVTKGSVFSIILPLTNSKILDIQQIRRVRDMQHKQEDKLTNEDIESILPFVAELKGYEVYQVSDIFRSLQKIHNLKNEHLSKWVQQVTDAVLLCDQDEYSDLINLTKNE